MWMSEFVSFLRVCRVRFLAIENHTIISVIQGKDWIRMLILVPRALSVAIEMKNSYL